MVMVVEHDGDGQKIPQDRFHRGFLQPRSNLHRLEAYAIRCAWQVDVSQADAKIPFVPPQLATLVDTTPEGDQWLHEIKFDGYRILCKLENRRATLWTRTGQDWTDDFTELATAAARIDVRSALFDGEAVIVRADGTTSFQALQHHLSGQSGGRFAYFAFDLLFLDGRDLRQRPLEERRHLLRGILDGDPVSVVRFSDHVVGNGRAFFQKASEAGLEGIVSKRRGDPYRSGRSPSWLKTKAIRRQEFVVGGFTEPEGSRSGIGALLVGFFRDQSLVYAGKVGTGFSQKAARELRRRLDLLLVAKSPFQGTVPAAGRKLRWVTPRLVAEIAFSEMTDDGKLRHPSFQGLREDKLPTDVVEEVPEPVSVAAKSKRGRGLAPK
jgi:bifunctional non-homologous end joining protein LigD